MFDFLHRTRSAYDSSFPVKSALLLLREGTSLGQRFLFEAEPVDSDPKVVDELLKADDYLNKGINQDSRAVLCLRMLW